MEAHCPFCSPTNEEIYLRNLLCYARLDRFPINEGHLLVIPFRHEASFLSLTPDERNAALELISQAWFKLSSELQPDGYNIGINGGEAGGQTVMHAHLHLIPRFVGDVPDPRGGVRFVIPEKARYWQDASEKAKCTK